MYYNIIHIKEKSAPSYQNFILLCIEKPAILTVMTVNGRVRQVRLALGMTRTAFSKAICVSPGCTAEIENGHRAANGRIVRLICLTFGASEIWLKTGKGEMFQSSPVERKERILGLFDKLNPKFQEYALTVIDRLIKPQNEQKD
jgi:DNA-binding XRE family transcriptional regulator